MLFFFRNGEFKLILLDQLSNKKENQLTQGQIEKYGHDPQYFIPELQKEYLGLLIQGRAFQKEK